MNGIRCLFSRDSREQQVFCQYGEMMMMGNSAPVVIYLLSLLIDGNSHVMLVWSIFKWWISIIIQSSPFIKRQVEQIKKYKVLKGKKKLKIK